MSNDTKVYYVIRRTGYSIPFQYRDGTDCAPWVGSIEKAAHFETMAGAVKEAAKSFQKGNEGTQIVRVEETATPGGELREVPLGSPEQTGVVVKGASLTTFWTGGDTNMPDKYVTNIERAAVFNTLASAGDSLQRMVRKGMSPVTLPQFVGVAKSEPKVTRTETVLA